MNEKASKNNYLLFGLTFLFSVFGYELIFFIMTLYIFNLTRDAVNVSFFAVLTFIPKLLSPVYGLLADRFAKQKVLIFAALITAGLMFLLSLTIRIEWIYAIWFLTSILLAMIANLRGSLFADIVASGHYTAGNSVMLTLSNTARIAAPLLGGAAALLLDARGLFYVVCLIYLLAAGVCALIRSTPVSASRQQGKTGTDFMNGYRIIRQTPRVNFIFQLSFYWRLFLGLQVSLLVVYVKTFLAGNDAQYGVFMTLIGLGSVLGSLAGSWLGKFFSREKILTGGLALHYVTFAALGLIRQFYPACVVGFVSFAAFYAALVFIHTARDTGTPPAVRARVYGTVTAIITFPAIVSMLAGGYLAGHVGANWILLAAGLLALASQVIITIRYIRNKQTLIAHDSRLLTDPVQ